MVSLAGSALTAFCLWPGRHRGRRRLRTGVGDLAGVEGGIVVSPRITASSQLEIDQRSLSIAPNLCDERWLCFPDNLNNLWQRAQERFRQRLSAKVALSG